jgi:hypothetical protein
MALPLLLTAGPQDPPYAGLPAISLYVPLAVALALALASEILGRYLFFVSAVPKHLAAPYLATAREAA